MTFTLTSYQSKAVDGVLAELRDAQDVFTARSKKTAVGLSAPTGAGKTVIATSVLERLIFGDSTAPANPNLAILWVTDDPALNRQTAEKMLDASARFQHGDLITLDSSFDAKTLLRGRIHFLNIQQMGVSTNAAWSGRDSREYGLWDTLAHTATAFGSDFLVVIDEAHRGTEGKVDATIVERICHGGPYPSREGIPLKAGQHPAAPVIFGITATPDRFKKAMDRQGRSLESIEVPISEVRESGLLKDRIVVRHPGESQPANETLLGLAVDALKRTDEAWSKHFDIVTASGEPVTRVLPLLVIQVAPGTKGADMAPMLDTLRSECPTLIGDAIVHAFQEHTAMIITTSTGEQTVKYRAPERIASDPHARVVFFKNALTTGWDCPRAEVMLSLRSAKDFTNIAQLIGRMVRTPLADRIETPGTDTDTLNSVALYLPHYDKKQVAKVVAALGSETGDDIEVTVEPIDCVKRTHLDDGRLVPDVVWDILEALPSATRVKKSYRSQTERLLALARLLNGHDLLPDAISKAKARLMGAITTESAFHAADLKKSVDDVTTLDMTVTVWDNRAGAFVEANEEDNTKVAARLGDIDSQYKTAKRLMPDALATWYWNHLLNEDSDLDPYEAKAHVAALTKTPEMATAIIEAVEKAAGNQIEAWRTQYANQVAMLSQGARHDFEGLWSPRTGTLTVQVEIPGTVSAPTEKITGTGEHATTVDVPTYSQHLYVAPDGQARVTAGTFPAVLTSWEVDVLVKETGYQSLVGWYRNPPRSKHGLAIPYVIGTDPGLLYPDFLFFHEVDGGVFVDVIDPHGHHASDTGPKWAGLARWAAAVRISGATSLRRTLGVIKVDDNLLALDLAQDGIADRLDACATKSDIEALFADKGVMY